MSYEDDIVIDEDAFDVEWLEQPRRMRNYCKLTAEARRKMDLAKEHVDFVRAQLERNIRADPAAHGVVPGLRGVTEDAIRSTIQIQDDYQIAVRAHIDARYEYDVAKGTVDAFEHRKSALENLVRLLGQGYFAGPLVPRDISEERAQRDRLVQRNVKISRGAPESPPPSPTVRFRRL